MFDPTAYENMKVVLEGSLYDRDLAGEIHITNRDDIVNLSKLSRQYKVSFQHSLDSIVTATFSLTAKLENFVAEMLPNVESHKKAGCQIKIQFFINSLQHPDQFVIIDQLLKSVWGLNRKITYELISDPFGQTDHQSVGKVTLLFNRLVYEEQIEDLEEMIDYMITTVNELEMLIVHR